MPLARSRNTLIEQILIFGHLQGYLAGPFTGYLQPLVNSTLLHRRAIDLLLVPFNGLVGLNSSGPRCHAHPSCSGDLVHGYNSLLLRLARSGTSSLHIAARHGNRPSATPLSPPPDLGGLVYPMGSCCSSCTTRFLAGGFNELMSSYWALLVVSLGLLLALTGRSPEDKRS